MYYLLPERNKGLPLFWTNPETALKEAIPEGIAVSMTRETPYRHSKSASSSTN